MEGATMDGEDGHEQQVCGRRSFLRIGLGAGSVMLLAACAAPAPPAVQPPTTAVEKPAASAATRPFVFAVRTEAVTLDPHVNDLSYSQYAQRPIYESLVAYKVGADGKVELSPLLAEKWEVSPDGRAYTFSLRKGVQFTEGTPFDAEAVKWNIDRLTTLKLPPSGRMPPLEAVEVVDPSTIRFVLKNPFAPFLASMVMPLMISPVAAKQHEQNGDWGKAWLDGNAVGTGPYKLDQWLRGQQISFAKNPDYWRGWSENHLAKLVLKTVKEAPTQRQMLELGDADLADGIGFDDLDALSNAPGVEVEPGISPEILNIGFHTQRPPFDNARIRQAVAHAFDYEAFLMGVLNGRGKTPAGPIPYGSWALDETLTPYARDLGKAKQLMAEAGYPNGGFKVRIQTIAAYGWYQPREAQLLQQNLKELGIEATIDDKADAATFLAALQEKEKGPDIFFWRAAQSIDDPDYELRRLYHSKFVGRAGVNGMWYENPKFDELLDRALALPERRDRKPLYDEIQTLLREDQPAIWPAQLDFFVTRRQTVQGFVWNPFSNGIPSYYDLWLSK
jgi:peptide/nickel transport system substrate-binding protein